MLKLEMRGENGQRWRLQRCDHKQAAFAPPKYACTARYSRTKIAEKRDLEEPSRVRGSYFASEKSHVVSRFKFKEEKKNSHPKNLKVRRSVVITEFLLSPQAFPRLASKKGERGMMGTSAERGG